MDIERIAQIAFLKLKPDEKANCEKRVQKMLDESEQLLQLDLAKVQPTTRIIRQELIRDDVVVPPSNRDDLLRNAKEKDNGAFVVPKIVE